MKTKVVFRIYRDGSVIALFPRDPQDTFGNYCVSYMHIGQHGGASPYADPTTRLATPAEYADLKKELEGHGYDLDVCARITRNDHDARKAAAKATLT